MTHLNERTAALFYSMPSIGAYKAEPLSSVEIDAEPNADRIWATILGLKDVADDHEQDALEGAEFEHRGERDSSYNDGEVLGRAELLREIESVFHDVSPPEELEFIEEVEWGEIRGHVLAILPYK